MNGLALKKFAQFVTSAVSNASEKDLALTPKRVERRRKSKKLSLWESGDPRLDLALFSANVPSFILNQEQRFLDWNPAFELIFGHFSQLRRGAHVSHWYDLLDNYRRVSQRIEKLYGEGILPITDRERVTFISEDFGRMVFTRIMNPIVDRHTGRIVGWTVVLNINSINQRQNYLEKLFALVAAQTRQVRYAASYDGLLSGFHAHQDLLAKHAAAMKGKKRILDLGAATGLMTRELLQRGHQVTAVEHDLELARQLRDRSSIFAGQLKIVRQNPSALQLLPQLRYDGAVLHDLLHKVCHAEEVLQQVFSALKPGGVLSLSCILSPGHIAGRFEALREDLTQRDLYDSLKYQFNHVLEYEQDLEAKLGYQYPTREELNSMLCRAGFSIEAEFENLVDGCTYWVSARKPL